MSVDASATTVSTTSAEDATSRTRTHRALQAAVFLAPAALILVLGWQRRWMDEDAFINLRIVDQLFAGHGPVFNAGERIEAYTSPLWLGVLALARGTLGQLMAIEWATVVTCLAMSVAAFALGAYAGRRLHADDELTVPVGLLAVAVIPVVWDFSTSGLEVGMTWLWLAGVWALLLYAADASEPIVRGRRVAALVLLGLGPLVRPDLGLISVCVIAAWILITRDRWRAAIFDVAVAIAAPVVYQVFRMGYFASVVPSTALAKDAGGFHFSQGLDYAQDLVSTYWLWIPLACVAVVVGRNLWRSTRPFAIASGALVLGAGLHALYFVLIGGDYMHGRLLLPALFALALPASLGIKRGNLFGYGLVGIIGVWGVVCATSLRFDQPAGARFTVVPISDRRELNGAQVLAFSKHSPNFIAGDQVAALYADGVRGYIPLLKFKPVPGKDPDRLAVAMGSIGNQAYTAGEQVFVVDLAGLAEPLAAHTAIVPGRAAGHRKNVDLAWYDARFAAHPTGKKALAAKRALACAPIADLLRAVDAPITPGRFFSNIVHSVSYTRLHIPADPEQAERELCPGSRASRR